MYSVEQAMQDAAIMMREAQVADGELWIAIALDLYRINNG